MRNEAMQKIVEAIREVGPRNISEIARMTKIPVETVRYRIKKQLREKGIMINAVVNYEKLGLRRYWLNLNFTENGDKHAVDILDNLAVKGYLTYYAKTFPKGIYVAQVALPPKFKEDYKSFLNTLLQLGVLKNHDMWELSWFRFMSMRTEYYDFERNQWILDWNKLEEEAVKIENPVEMDVEKKPKIDKIDLMILAHLQANSFSSVTRIAEKINENSRKVRYHFLNHVIRKGLIGKYTLLWSGTKKEDIMRLILQFSNLNKQDLILIEQNMHKLPFITSDSFSRSKNLYLVIIHSPLAYYIDILRFIYANLPGSVREVEVMVADPLTINAYTLPYELFDDREREWRLNVQELLNFVEQKISLKT